MPTYRDIAIEALIACQAIEFGLKQYISAHYKATKILLKSADLHYGLDSTNVESASLERLVTIFCSLNNNVEFKKSLSKFVRSRNHLAHQALLHDSPARGVLKSDLEVESERIGSILVESTTIANGLTSEIRALVELVNKIEPR
jgi:hypothetical protein